MTKPTKLLKDYYLGEEISKEEGIEYFGKEIMDCFELPIKLVAITWTIQDKDGTQIDYNLKNKDYIEREDNEDD